MASCNQTNSTKGIVSRTNDIKRDRVIGSWDLAEKLSQNIKNAEFKSENEKILGFTLNADSSAAIILNNSSENLEKSGTWTWKEEKNIGNNNFGFSLKQDLIITFEETKNNRYILALQPSEIQGKLLLASGSKSVYEKRSFGLQK